MTESLTLKEKYQHHKALKQARQMQEAKEFLESVVLVTEKLDTPTISRIVDAMNGVEEALAPFLPKLRSLQTGLDAAEAELISLISGKGGNDPKKTRVLLGKALGFYQGISEFLRDDLPVLLKSRNLNSLKSQPDVVAGAKSVPFFKQALAVNRPSGLLGKLFGSTNIPYVDNDALARELSTLTYNELVKLSQVGKVPMVASQAQIDQAAAQAVGQMPSQAPAAPMGGDDKAGKVKAAVAKALTPWVTDPKALDAAVQAALSVIE